MDDYMKAKLAGMQNELRDLFEVVDQSTEDYEEQFYRSLLSAVDNILTVGYVRNRDGQISSDYALEKLKMSKFYIDWAVNNCERSIGDENHD